jgi:hypothetical protein
MKFLLRLGALLPINKGIMMQMGNMFSRQDASAFRSRDAGCVAFASVAFRIQLLGLLLIRRRELGFSA